MSKSSAVPKRMPDVAPAPFQTLLSVAGGYLLPRCLHVVAKLGVADALGEKPQTAAELASATGTNADALSRVLRLLASQGIFEHRDGRFGHSAASQLLRQDHAQSMRALVQMLGFAPMWAITQNLEDSVRTGQPAVSKVLPAAFGTTWKSIPKKDGFSMPL